jgi:hypothetical protein
MRVESAMTTMRLAMWWNNRCWPLHLRLQRAAVKEAAERMLLESRAVPHTRGLVFGIWVCHAQGLGAEGKTKSSPRGWRAWVLGLTLALEGFSSAGLGAGGSRSVEQATVTARCSAPGGNWPDHEASGTASQTSAGLSGEPQRASNPAWQ